MTWKTNSYSEEHQKLEATYMEERKQLMDKERKLRYDYAFRQSLSSIAKRAANIVSNIRNYESETVWRSNGIGADDEFRGMMFTLAKPKIKTTKLWEIVRKMPKGALLHAHLEAMVNIKWLWTVVLETPGMYMFSDVPLDSKSAFDNAKIEFTYSPIPVPGKPSDIFASTYQPSGLVCAKDIAEIFPAGVLSNNSPGGVVGYLEWLESKTTITPEESLKHHEGIDKVWAKFQSIFLVLNGAIWYEPIFRKLVRHLFEKLYEDGIFWVDLRIAFHMNFQEDGTGRVLPKTDVLRIFGEILEQYKADNPEFWGSRVIWTSLRSLDNEIIKENMEECIKAKEAYPELLAGYDLVGQEDAGHSLHELIPELLWFKQECAKRNLSIPFYFHAGETVDEGSAADNNAFDAILLGTKRIGHGYSLCRHPHLMNLVKEKQICIETCPISNEILRLTASILSHPLPELVAHGVPTTINNDDPGILGQEDSGSLSHDYWQALQAFGNFGLSGIGSLARTSVKFATYDDHMDLESKYRLRKLGLWDTKWEEFCRWVVETFGEWEK